jgi:hypothetical protein
VEDAFADLVDRAYGGYAEQHAPPVVVVEQRTRRGGEHLEAVADGLGVVVGPSPPGQPMQQLLLGHLQVDGRVQRRAQPGQVLIQRPGLGDAAGEAVQQEPALAVGLGQPLQHHRDHDLVGDQLARVQVGLGDLAQRGAVGHVGPQEVAGGQVHQLESGRDPVRLGALARPRRTQQQDPHALIHPQPGSERCHMGKWSPQLRLSCHESGP